MFVGILKREKGKIECRELHSEAAVDAFLVEHPEAEVMTFEQFKLIERALQNLNEHMAPKPGFFARLFSK